MPTDPPYDPIRARLYPHPHLGGGRVVARPVGDSAGPGDDCFMSALGFGEPRVSPPLAGWHLPTLAFPARVPGGDPGGALAACRALEAAVRRAVGRSTGVVERIAAIAEDLPPAELPGFWERAARHYLDAGQPQRASAMFLRARRAEDEHGLAVDEPGRRAAYLRFALAGALSAKAVTAYADGLAARHDPPRAYAELLELAAGYVRGGLPPWPALPRQVRTMAKAAGLDVTDEETRVLAGLLRVPATRHADAAFWKANRPRLVRLARRSPGLRRALLHLFPEADMDVWWLDLLDEAGAIADLTRGDAAAWLTRMAAHLRRGRRTGRTPRALLDLVGRIRPGAEPIRLTGGGPSWTTVLDADLLDACLAAGLPVADPRPGDTIDLGRWLTHRERDLAAVGADPRYARLLSAAVGGFAARRGVGALLGVPALRPLVRDWILAEAGEIAAGGLADAREAVHRLESGLRGAPGETAMPSGTGEAIERADLAGPLRRTLRAGILDELGWDDLDAAADELGPDAEITTSWPVITLYTRRRAIAVGPSGRVAEHEPRLPGTAESCTVVYSAGAFLVVWDDDGRTARGYWSADDGARSGSGPVTRADGSLRPRAGHGYAFLDAAGARVTGRRALTPGELRLADTPRLLCDGVTYWSQPEAWRPELRELDPSSGALGRASLPGFLERAPLPEGHTWAVEACTLAPLPEGVRRTPLGTDGTLVGFRVSRNPAGGHLIEGVDGRRAEVRGREGTAPWGLLDLPAADRWGVLAGDTLVWLIDPLDGTAHWQVAAGTGDRWIPPAARQAARGTPVVPPPAFWHFLAPRDPEASARLRSIPESTVRALLDAAVADLTEDRARGGLPRAAPLIAALAAHPRLRAGLTGFVREAADLRLRLATLAERARSGA
ncbi:hypothetical protein [Spongiactinospora sp. TRM90649]|uniref:hypothetical protein n=1 Tax=Spongiactinospora sp. TRM90649 TaxID=3031114 RepID=UPI0023F8E6F8|nr:hypothetical protein [Spongiactinospora sp. TRM90649]MDF5755874.1 hypothetical protein [Spongiactinospora sp. TRM90649]